MDCWWAVDDVLGLVVGAIGVLAEDDGVVGGGGGESHKGVAGTGWW